MVKDKHKELSHGLQFLSRLQLDLSYEPSLRSHEDPPKRRHCIQPIVEA